MSVVYAHMRIINQEQPMHWPTGPPKWSICIYYLPFYYKLIFHLIRKYTYLLFYFIVTCFIIKDILSITYTLYIFTKFLNKMNRQTSCLKVNSVIYLKMEKVFPVVFKKWFIETYIILFSKFSFCNALFKTCLQ